MIPAKNIYECRIKKDSVSAAAAATCSPVGNQTEMLHICSRHSLQEGKNLLKVRRTCVSVSNYYFFTAVLYSEQQFDLEIKPLLRLWNAIRWEGRGSYSDERGDIGSLRLGRWSGPQTSPDWASHFMYISVIVRHRDEAISQSCPTMVGFSASRQLFDCRVYLTPPVMWRVQDRLAAQVWLLIPSS